MTAFTATLAHDNAVSDGLRRFVRARETSILLALVVVALLVSLVGGWIFGIAIAAVALILFVLFLAGFGRRTASSRQP